MAYGKVVIALGTNYMVNRSTNAAVNAGLWMLAAGYLSAAFTAALATDDPRGVHTYPGRARRFLARLVCGRRGGGGRRSPPPPGRLTLVASSVPDPETGKAGPHTVRLATAGEHGWREGGGVFAAAATSARGRRVGAGAASRAPAPPALAPSDVVLEWLIGTGSFASVFRASYAGSPCAVKVLSAGSAARRAAAKAEAGLGLSLRHPCILATFAVLDVDIDVDAAASLDSTASPPAAGGRRNGGTDGTASAALAEFGSVLHGGGGGAGGGGGGPLVEEAGAGGGAAAADSPAAPVLAASPASPPPPPPAPTLRQQTWIVQELADRGTLDRAIRKGAFRVGGGGGGSGGGWGGVEAKGDGSGRQRSPPSSGAAFTTTTPAKSGGGISGGGGSGGGAQLAAPSPSLQPPASPSPAAAALATLHDVAAGLAYLHAVGIVHGDLKPANILLRSRARDAAGRPFSALVADFGLSRVLATTAGASPRPPGAEPAAPTHVHTQTFGTVCYVAPELIREGRLSRAADLYALGVLMWEVWSGRPPFRSLHAASIFYAVGVEGRRPEPALVGAPEGYVALMEELWADALHARPSAAEAARRIWEMLEAEVGPGAPCPASPGGVVA